ncbi:MAG: hypothetical protein WB615_13415 [Candidatus Tumulicola sp.]
MTTSSTLSIVRTALLALAALLAACSHGSGDRNAAGPGGVAVYPAGIVVPADYAAGSRAGIYSSDESKTCCFLAGSSQLTLDNPSGAQLAVFTFYVPSVAPLKNGETVRVRFDGRPAGAPAHLSPGMQDVTFPIRPSLRDRRITASLDMSVKWVPKKIGLNADLRELSVVLVRVGYI